MRLADLPLKDPALRVLNKYHLELLSFLGLYTSNVRKTFLGLVGQDLTNDGLALLLHLLLLLHFHLGPLDCGLLLFIGFHFVSKI